MLGRLYEGQVCSAARTLEIVGERWSLLIVRNAMFAGTTRFSDFQRSLGVAPNVLTKRLDDLVAEGIFELNEPPDGGHAEYLLTDKGRDLMGVIVALTRWGDRWAAPDGAPVSFAHEGCGGRAEQRLMCTKCKKPLAPAEVAAHVALRFREKRYGWTGGLRRRARASGERK